MFPGLGIRIVPNVGDRRSDVGPREPVAEVLYVAPVVGATHPVCWRDLESLLHGYSSSGVAW